MRTYLLVPVTLVLAACGDAPDIDTSAASTTAATDTADAASTPTGEATDPSEPSSTASPTEAGDSETEPTTGGPEPELDGPGWTLRDRDPYGRSGHTTILDEAGDRMILHGGGANDTWQLPLSGPHANVWSELPVTGERPPVHAFGDSLFADAAVYDPARQRMLVLQNPTPVTAEQNPEVALWELSLSGAPKWRRLVTAGPDPGIEVQSGRLALDVAHDRLFVVGGALEDTGVWTLSLADPPTWTRVADTPAGELGPFYVDASLLHDAARDQLVLFGGHARLPRIWGLSLQTAAWTLLDEGSLASESYGATATLDAANDRVVIFGGDEINQIYTYSLATHTWTATGAGEASSWPVGASGALDAKRDRILYFGGVTPSADGGREAVNTTWDFSLADLTLTELLPATRRGDLAMGWRTAVWDPARQAVVAFGGSPTGETWTHGLAATDDWSPAAVGTTPGLSWMSAIHDPIGAAIIAFGGYDFASSAALMRLGSAPGSTWETLAVAGGPAARARHVAIYDAAQRRMIVHGGYEFLGGVAHVFTDTWSLALDGPPAWTELEPSGPQPPPRHSHVAIHDPEGQRMIIYGGRTEAGALLPDLWSLSLTDAPSWTAIKAVGPNPQGLVRGSAVLDPAGRRMIVLDLAPSPSGGESRVFALDLDDAPLWHRFCPHGLAAAEEWSSPGSAPNAVLVDDGLFVSVSGGALRFDLATPYCE